MEIEGRMMWQVAAGDTDRNYADLCLRWDVILNGPGSAGPWPECQKILQEEWGLTSKKISDIRRFSEELADGDIVALRMGTNNVLGVGVVVGGYIWNQEFGDVDGWNLQHLRRVRWLWKADPTPKSFETYALKFGDTTQIPKSRDWFSRTGSIAGLGHFFHLSGAGSLLDCPPARGS